MGLLGVIMLQEVVRSLMGQEYRLSHQTGRNHLKMRTNWQPLGLVKNI